MDNETKNEIVIKRKPNATFLWSGEWLIVEADEGSGRYHARNVLRFDELSDPVQKRVRESFREKPDEEFSWLVIARSPERRQHSFAFCHDCELAETVHRLAAETRARLDGGMFPRKCADGSTEIAPPRIFSDREMPFLLEAGNEWRRARARRLGLSERSCFECDFPVSGGWGYTMEDACIVESDESAAGSCIERPFIVRRTFEEIKLHPGPGTPDLEELEIQVVGQTFVHGKDGRVFDRIVVEVTGFRPEDKVELDKFECSHADHDGNNRRAAIRRQKTVFYRTVCWFDVTRRCKIENADIPKNGGSVSEWTNERDDSPPRFVTQSARPGRCRI